MPKSFISSSSLRIRFSRIRMREKRMPSSHLRPAEGRLSLSLQVMTNQRHKAVKRSRLTMSWVDKNLL